MNRCFLVLFFCFFTQCKKKNSEPLAAEDGSPISANSVSSIMVDTTSVEKITKEELTKIALKEPFNLKEKNAQALTRSDINHMPQSTNQIVAILVNRGILEWKSDALFDYLGNPCSKGMLNDYLGRLKVFLEQAKIKQREEALGLSLASADQISGSENLSDYLTSEYFGIAIGIISALGSLMWGYREWTLHTNDIKETKELLNTIKNADNFEKIKGNIKIRTKFPEIYDSLKNEKGDFGEQAKKLVKKEEKAGSKLLDFNSSKNGKFIYAPIIIMTAVGSLGITLNQIYDKNKEDDE